MSMYLLIYERVHMMLSYVITVISSHSMASTYSVEEDSFLFQVEKVRREIETRFEIAHNLLQQREAELLAELERLAYEYSGDGITQQIEELSISKEALRDSHKANENKAMFEESAALIDARIKALETKLQNIKDTYLSVSLEWEVELELKLSLAGEIQLRRKEITRDYREIGAPIAVFGKHIVFLNSPGIFRSPYHVVIHTESKYICICDGRNNRVQVFNKSFEFVSEFSKEMVWPVGICFGVNEIYVTQFESHCLNVYSMEGIFLKSVGRRGTKPLEFVGPRGLDVSSDKARIYVADCLNNRIQCLKLDLKFISLIDDIFQARDVKLTPNEVVVLSSGNPCVSLYSYSHQLIRKMIPCGEGNSIGYATALILDKYLNILIADRTRHCVCVFSFDGALIHRFGDEGEERGEFIHPTGIAIDDEGRIIVASHNQEHCLQVF